MGPVCLSVCLTLLNNVSKNLKQMTKADVFSDCLLVF